MKTTHFENQYSAWSDQLALTRSALKRPGLTYSEILHLRSIRNTARSMLYGLDKAEHQNDWHKVEVCTNAGVIDSSTCRFSDNVGPFFHLACMFADHFASIEDFDGCGGRMTKPEWVRFHEDRAGFHIGPEVWVEVNGERKYSVRVTEAAQ